VRRQFAERLDAVLSAGGRDRLEIEILESAALEDIGTVSSLIASFQQRGIRFALDDFGTGYSSLVHLKRLGADVLKIDQTFVRDMLDDPGDLAIVQGVVGLAGAFRRDVVAEGVEDMEHVRMLLAVGCDVMQGYGISRPLPAESLRWWLDAFTPIHSGYRCPQT
jgi:EAL domain-containing protein (putative c-di-GMP-specific phosphodiesterase class I)